MKKRMVVFSVLLLLSFFGMVRGDERVANGQELEMHTNLVNNLDEKLEDVQLRMLIYDLGIIIEAENFDIDDNDKVSKWTFWDVNAPPGEYLVRITASNQDYRDVKHRYITVI